MNKAISSLETVPFESSSKSLNIALKSSSDIFGSSPSLTRRSLTKLRVSALLKVPLPSLSNWAQIWLTCSSIEGASYLASSAGGTSGASSAGGTYGASSAGGTSGASSIVGASYLAYSAGATSRASYLASSAGGTSGASSAGGTYGASSAGGTS
jgi:hypothetical protein